MENSITIYIAPVRDAEGLSRQLLEDHFSINPADSQDLYKKSIKVHFDKLNDDCFLLAEAPYVDKVYRDSYYHYYSSKHTKYKRDCIRISLFQGEIQDSDFRNKERTEDLQKRYRGYIVLRPTDPFLIGRSVISPQIIKDNNCIICSAKLYATVNSVKFSIEGFPHSSQDTETLSCAETTLWAIMEYFGSRYPDYRPVLPSRIINTLDKVSFERQIPSRGLNISQISYALKEFGFGTRIYSKDEYGNDFEKILSCYIESGIPVITAVDNFEAKGKIGHAKICIGHEKLSPDHYALLEPISLQENEANKKIITALKRKNITLFDSDDIKKSFVFIDDNRPVYQKAALHNPCLHYNDPEWAKCRIRYLVVPLYKRIYLEAYEAKNFALNFLLVGPYPLEDNQQVILRFFLTSSRSFKNSLATNDTFSSDAQEKILSKPLPKFIWVGELSTKELLKENKASGLIILDATEANIDANKPLVLAAYGGNIVEPDFVTGELIKKPIPLAGFLAYENNLAKN